MEFKLREFLKCLFRGHKWTNSKAKPGLMTCRQCGLRRRPFNG
jgi:hypothetical protein